MLVLHRRIYDEPQTEGLLRHALSGTSQERETIPNPTATAMVAGVEETKGGMMYEMIEINGFFSLYACAKCGNERLYGVVRGPWGYEPTIQCSHCGRATPHLYRRQRERTLQEYADICAAVRRYAEPRMVQ